MILREEGPAALYKGFIPKVLRLAPGGGVLLLVVEFTLEMFRKGLFSHFFPIATLFSPSIPRLIYSSWASLRLSTLHSLGSERGVGRISIIHSTV